MGNIKKFFMYLMEKDDVNSRFALFASVLICNVSVLILTLGFLCSKNKPDYPSMIIAVGGVCGVGAVFGRAATKWVGNGQSGTTSDVPVNKGGDSSKL